jgi:hypothetical protein
MVLMTSENGTGYCVFTQGIIGSPTGKRRFVMDTDIEAMHGISAGDAAALKATQRRLSAITRLLTFEDQRAFLDLGDLQGDALRIVRDYTDQFGDILDASQSNPNCG